MLDPKTLPGALAANIQRVMIGKNEAVELMLVALLCRGHVLIEDVPGVGKTTLAMALARSLNCSFQRIQFTPDIMPSDLTGYIAPDPRTHELKYRPGLVMSQIILADEINRTSPKTQSSLLEVMDEYQVTVDGTTYRLPQPFIVLATQNPQDFAGTFPLPEAQLDRFQLCVRLGYPSVREEIEILKRFQAESPLDALQPVATSHDIIMLQQRTTAIYCADDIRAYIAYIVAQTRQQPELLLGVSPRGAIALMHAAQAVALLAGRDYVLPDDVQKMFLPVLAHRVRLKPEAKWKEHTVESVLKGILESINIPRGRT